MISDITTVAFGFQSAAPSGRKTSSQQQQDGHPLSRGQVDSAPFAALKAALTQAPSVTFGRRWSLQIEGRKANHDSPCAALGATFQRVDFFLAAWTACVTALSESPYALGTRRNAKPHAQACPWEVLREALPSDVGTLRLWASSLPTVLQSVRSQQNNKANTPQKQVNPNASFGSNCSNGGPANKSSLKFTQTTVSLPIRELLAAPSASAGSTRGDGEDFATSRVIRIDVLRSAMNQVALLLLGGGACPVESASCDPSVPESPGYQSSVGMVGVQFAWVPGSTTNTPPLSGKPKSSSSTSSGNGPSDEETSKATSAAADAPVVLATDVTLEIQFLSQSSSNAGKKAIEAAVREFLPAAFFEPPTSLLIGIANLQDGSLNNMTLRSPSLAPAAASSPMGGSASTPSSWSAAVSGPLKLPLSVAASPKTSSPPDSTSKPRGEKKSQPPPIPRSPVTVTATASLPANFPQNAAEGSAEQRQRATKKSSAATSALKQPKSPCVAKQEHEPSESAAPCESKRLGSPSAPSVTMEESILRQAQLLLMHAQDLGLMRFQFDELVHGHDPSRLLPSNHSSLSISNSLGSSGVSASTTLTLLASQSPLVSSAVLDAAQSATRTALTALKQSIVGAIETSALVAPDFESTIGPSSKMLKRAIASGDVGAMQAYADFQRDQKKLLQDAVSAYAVLFGCADTVVSEFERQLTLLNLEVAEFRVLEDACRESLAACLTSVSSSRCDKPRKTKVLKRVGRQPESSSPLSRSVEDDLASSPLVSPVMRSTGTSQTPMLQVEKDTQTSLRGSLKSGQSSLAGSAKESKKAISAPQHKHQRTGHTAYLVLMLLAFAVAIVAAAVFA